MGVPFIYHFLGENVEIDLFLLLRKHIPVYLAMQRSLKHYLYSKDSTKRARRKFEENIWDSKSSSDDVTAKTIIDCSDLSDDDIPEGEWVDLCGVTKHLRADPLPPILLESLHSLDDGCITCSFNVFDRIWGSRFVWMYIEYGDHILNDERTVNHFMLIFFDVTYYVILS